MIRFSKYAVWLTAVAMLSAGLARAADAPAVISIKNFMFTQKTVTVTAGTTVTWRNDDEEPHTVASLDGLFRSGGLDTGQAFSFKFERPGTYNYICTIHPQMKAQIIVVK